MLLNANGCDTSYILNNTIFNNTKGIVSSTGYGLIIKGNTIYNNIQEGVYCFGRMQIQENKIYNNGGGIYFDGSGVRIENNEIYNNKSTFTGGISGGVNDGGAYIMQNVIFNNTSINGNGAGVELAPDNNFNLPAYVVSNTVCNNRVGINGKGNNFYATTNTSSGLDIKFFNNIIYNVSEANNNIEWFHDVSHEINFNCINQDSINIWGEYNIDDIPQFIKSTDSTGVMSNIGMFDWSLKQNSHCINAGDSLDISFLLPFDYAGNPRIFNNRVDIGAYEYQGYYNSVNEINTISSIYVFPNPFNNNLNVTISFNGLSEIVIYDIISRKLCQQIFTNSTTLNTKQLSKGIYIYEIRNKNGIIKNGKIIKY